MNEEQQAWLLEQYRRENMSDEERKAEKAREYFKERARKRRSKPGVLAYEAARRAELRRLYPEKYRALDKIKRAKAMANETPEHKAQRLEKRRMKRKQKAILNTPAHQREKQKVSERNKRYYQERRAAGYYDTEEYKTRIRATNTKIYIKKKALMTPEENHAYYAAIYARRKARIDALPEDEREAFKAKEKARKKASREKNRNKKKIA